MRTLVVSQLCFDSEDPDWLRCAFAADIYARQLRVSGCEAFFVAGLEAHASRNLHEARVKGVDVKLYLASKRRGLAELFDQLHLSPDTIVDTSSPKHAEVLNRIFNRMVDEGLVVRGAFDYPACPDDGRLYDEVEGSCPKCGSAIHGLGCCPSCGGTLDPGEIKGAVCSICDAPIELRRGEGWLYSGGEALGAKLVCADSAGPDFGVPYWYEEKTRFDPWFSAAAAAITPLEKSGWSGGDDMSAVYFATKRFGACHSEVLPKVFEAAGLKAAGLSQVVVGHVDIVSDRGALRATSSKLLKHLGADYARYALCGRGLAGNITLDVAGLQREINDKLVDTLGQFAQRVLQFAHSKFGSVPKLGELSEEDRGILDSIGAVRGDVERALASLDYGGAYDVLIRFAERAAQYYTRQAPWSLVKVNFERASTVVHVSLLALRALGVLCYPLLPGFSEAVLGALGVDARGGVGVKLLEQPLVVGSPIGEPRPVYTKLTDRQVEELVADCLVEVKPQIDIAEFLRLDLRVATVVAAERVPNTKRLLKLRVRVGEKLRTIVSSIGEQYSPEELVGRKIVVLMNLKPSVFAGVASRGMLLAAEGGGVISLLTPMRDVEDGSWVH